MPETTREQLGDLFSKQVRAAGDEAVRLDGQIAPEQIESLKRLAGIIELYEKANPTPTRKRWPIIVALTTTLLIVSLLLFARVRETEIELDVTLSEVNFVFPTQQVLAEGMNLASLGVSGLQEIQIPRARNRDPKTMSSSDGEEPAVHLSVASEGNRPGSITLAPLTIQPGSRVWLRHTGLPRQYRLSVKGTDINLSVNVNGPVQVTISGETEQLDFVSPKAALLRSSKEEVDLDLTLSDRAERTLTSQLSANNLSFIHIDEFRESNYSVAPPRRASTILSGNLSFESLNGLERKLRAGELIEFEHSQGEIRTLYLQDGQIDLKFHGLVRGMSVGSEENRRSLMPTWLEWLQARHTLSLLWGTALYLFALIAGALRWWRNPV